MLMKNQEVGGQRTKKLEVQVGASVPDLDIEIVISDSVLALAGVEGEVVYWVPIRVERRARAARQQVRTEVRARRDLLGEALPRRR